MSIVVSVVIAARNEEIYVEEAVRSILTQPGVPMELVFVDDASTDRTLEIVRRLAGEFPNLRVAENPDPGKVRAFNLGIQMAAGEWVCIFSGDDIMPEGSLRARWEAVKDVVSAKPVIGVCKLITLSEDPAQNGRVVPRDPSKGAFSGSCYMMGRAALAKMWPVPTQFPNEDTWLELCAHHFDLEVVHTPVIGCAWRIHANNSINLLVPFKDFNAKYTPRMAAAEVFLEKHHAELSPQSLTELRNRVACETARREGSLLRVLLSGAGLRMKLRAASYVGPRMYSIRQRAYSLFTGW
jgi:glycosyltransferase involved in cell wall biosynthesis